MVNKPSYKDLERKINQLKIKNLDYMSKIMGFSKNQELIKNSHMRRSLSLMKINEELIREIKELKNADKEELEFLSNKVKKGTKELKCIYGISRLKAGTNFSLDDVLQTVVDYIPSATNCPENACARIVLEGYEFTTNNYKDTKWKISQDIMVNNERFGALEVCYIEEKESEYEERQLHYGSKSLIAAIADNIAQIVERELAEIEIRKSWNKIENPITNND